MHLKSAIITLITILSISSWAISADFSPGNVEFNHISFKDGLPNSRVDCMIEDHEGYLWFGTKRGLCRYNGYEFKTYKSQINDTTSLRYHQISCLLESSDGTLWVGTWNGGVHKYNRKEDSFIRVDLQTKSTLSRNQYLNTNIIFENSNGDILVGVLEGLFIIPKDSKKKIAEIMMPDGREPITGVSSIFENKSGLLYIASSDFKSNFTYDPELNKTSRVSFNSASGILPERISQIYPIDDKNLWIIATNGLFNFNRETKEINFVKHGNSPKFGTKLNFILRNKDGNLWIGGDGLFFYDNKNKKFEKFINIPDDPKSISGNIITCGYRDTQDNLWFGTFSRGINVIYKKTKHFAEYPELTERLESISKNINSIYKNKEGLLFIGTWDKGLLIADNKNQIVNSDAAFSGLNHLKDKIVRTITGDSKGNVWIGSEDCILTRFNTRSKQTKIYQIEDPVMDIPQITKILIDSQNRFWVGTSFSLFLFDPTTESFTSHINTINVLDMEEDDNGNIWCAGYDIGLCRINKDNSVSYFKTNGENQNLPDDKNVTVFKDSRSRMWVGTEFNGLFLHNPDSNKFEHFTVKDGLPSNDICSIQEDYKGRLWIGTNNGLSRFNYSLKDFTNYFRSDGMNADEFHYNSNFTDKSGVLYFGCTNGLVIFEPDNIRGNYLTYPVKLEGIAVNNGTVTEDIKGIPIGEALRMNRPFKLKYNQNTINFKYTTLNYSFAKKSNFAYQLVGLDDDFNYVKDQRQITYTNLNPGKYIFRVIASNNDNIWDRKGTEVMFTIKNPPWLTWWAYTIYGILLLLILYAYRYRVRYEEKMKTAVKLERIEKNQQKELTQMKLRFFTNISHEFKTPLTLIIGPLEQIIADLHGNSGLKTKLANISANSKRLLELINQLIDFRKIEQDVLPLKKTRNNLIETTQKIMTSFNPIAIRNEIVFTLNSDFESIAFNYDSDKIEKILNNILSNAFKYTSQGGNISIRIWHSEETNVCITISDTGSGIEQAKVAKLFERFNSNIKPSDNNFEMQSSGIGLAYSKKLVELHSGSLKMESRPGKGTNVTIELPYDRELIPTDGKAELNKQRAITELSEDTLSEVLPTETETDTVTDLTDAPRVLVVEDDDELRKYIVSILMDRYQIDEAEDGQIGYDLALKNDYDLIVSDVMMPNMSGTQLCEKLKSNIKTSHVFVIILTAKSDISSKIEGYETGADSYITKPFLPKHLIQVIKNLLNTQSSIKAFFTSTEEKGQVPQGIHPRDKQFIEDAITIIEKNIDEDKFSVEVLGKELALSRTHLFRKFKSLTGTAPNDFIRQIKLKKAAQVIKEGNHSISEIAYMVGFKTPANFSTSFKAFYGKSPKEYQADSAF
jgi:signal transduction histidine kinase/ligand-binding sensor domain-containing protein/DNA-binding response OmpR family regulator